MGVLDETFRPVKFDYVHRLLGKQPQILDIGCGNHSPRVAKKWFPDCYYVGVDIQQYNNDDRDIALLDDFVLVGADGSGYGEIPNESFDFVVMNHVVEHMADAVKVVAEICRKIRRGGIIWIAFPSIKSLSFPSAAPGTLHFCDDDTHIRAVDVKEIANILLQNEVKIIHAGRSRNLPRFLVGLGMLPVALVSRVLTGRMSRGLWYVLGFEDHVLGLRR